MVSPEREWSRQNEVDKKMLYRVVGSGGASVGFSVGGGYGYWVGGSLGAIYLGSGYFDGVVVVG